MFSFFGNISWWLLLSAQFFAQAIIAVGTFGKGASRDTLPGIGLIAAIICIIGQWLGSGFFAFILGIVAWFIFMPLANNLVLRWLGKIGIVSEDPQLAFELAVAQETTDLKWKRYLSITRKRNDPKHILDILSNDTENDKQSKNLAKSILMSDPFLESRNINNYEENIDEIIDLIQYWTGSLPAQTIVRIVKHPGVFDSYSRWRTISNRIMLLERDKDTISLTELKLLRTKLEDEAIEFQSLIRGIR